MRVVITHEKGSGNGKKLINNGSRNGYSESVGEGSVENL
jgi:hypothetical protein